VVLTVEEDGKEEQWLEARTWDRIGPHDRAYLLSPETGEILFGNGLHGRVPTFESTITVKGYRIGGGTKGNVLAGTLTKSMSGSTVTVQQPFAATGGTDAETLENAKARAITWLEEPRRAVTLNDFKYLAMHVPGVPVARAHTIVDYDPTLPCAPALGSITVVIVPPCPRPIPEPGPDMIDAVQHYLDPRRTLTSEIHVMSPSFITVAVQAHLHTESEIDSQSLIDQAQAKLDAFFHPLTGGQDGNGWPIGRDVYRSEVMALLNSISGVTHVDDVALQVQAELETYAGLVTFKRIIQPSDVPLQVSARLFVEHSVIAHRLVDCASFELETYIRSQRGWLKHRKPEMRREEVTTVLRTLPGVINVEEVNLSEESPDGLCENAPVCPNSLVISGQHQITVSGAPKKNSTRVTKPAC
jgi:phage-related baseplate assembly protein